MSDLLLHSMAEFSDIILSCLAAAGVVNIAEVGAEFGGMSEHLGAFAAAAGGVLTSIDPAPKPAFVEWSAGFAASRHIAAPSLAAIPTLSGIDAWTIDGDHNHYTVLNELRAIDAVTRRDGKPLLAFLHDVGWPCARRDLYYAPDQIPPAHRQPYDYRGGAFIDHDALVPDRGFRGHGNFAFATHAGGPGNGVLTAVEDFIAEAGATGRELAWAFIPAVFGLGILFDVDAPWGADVADLLMPFHNNALIARLDDNRLRNYLKVIDLQDRAAAT
jgi:hypothetical protein